MPGQFGVILIMLEMLLQSQSQIEYQFYEVVAVAGLTACWAGWLTACWS